MSDFFQNVTELAKLLSENPALHNIFAEEKPKEYEMVLKMASSPFFQWKPFGVAEGSGTCQHGFLKSRSRNKWAITGNRCGKTESGLIEDVSDCLLIDSITRSRSFKYAKPIRMWAVSDTEETSINVLERILVDRILGTDESGFMWNFVSDASKYTARSGWANHQLEFTNGSFIQFKFSTQKRNTFQGTSLHKVHFDEVQPKDIYGECQARLADTNGYFIGTMTPIYDKTKGIPWIYEDLYLRRDDKDLEFHTWSLLDNPYVDEAAKARLMREWDEDEIEARVYGAFVPMGVKLALPSTVMREIRTQLKEYVSGSLELLEDGTVSFHEDRREIEIDGLRVESVAEATP